MFLSGLVAPLIRIPLDGFELKPPTLHLSLQPFGVPVLDLCFVGAVARPVGPRQVRGRDCAVVEKRSPVGPLP
jgi:hypothetical protein